MTEKESSNILFLYRVGIYVNINFKINYTYNPVYIILLR